MATTKGYKSMKSAANALKTKGVNVCANYFSLSISDKNEVKEVMEKTKSFRPNTSTGKSKPNDFFDRMRKYSSCNK